MVLEDRNGSEPTGDETTSQLLPCAIGTEPRETGEAKAEAMDRSGSLGLCCQEARSGTKPSGLLFAFQCAGLKAIPIIPPDLSSSPKPNKILLTTTSSTSSSPTRRRSPSSASTTSPPAISPTSSSSTPTPSIPTLSLASSSTAVATATHPARARP